MKLHAFEESVQKEQDAQFEEQWDAAYRSTFSVECMMKTVCRKSFVQSIGIDRVITLTNGRTIYIDEKLRFEEYDDILIEIVSNNNYNTPGWIAKDLSIDYLAYGFCQSKRIYILDFRILQRVWSVYGNIWVEKFETIKAKNHGYETISVPIPIDLLLSKMQGAISINNKKTA